MHVHVCMCSILHHEDDDPMFAVQWWRNDGRPMFAKRFDFCMLVALAAAVDIYSYQAACTSCKHQYTASQDVTRQA